MKRGMKFSLVLALFVFLINVSFVSAATPISNCDELQAMKNNPNENYCLIKDIDCYETINWNDGKGFEPIRKFTGTLDGGFYEISGLFINRTNSSGDSSCGLFASTNNALVENVILNDVEIYGTSATGGLVGTLVDSIIKNSGVKGNVSGTKEMVGGLVGESFGSIINMSFSEGSVSGLRLGVGGLVGSNELNGIITDSYSKSNARNLIYDIRGYYVGGLVGTNEYVHGKMGKIINSYSTGTVKGSYWCGGFIGNSVGMAKSCFWDKESSKLSIATGTSLSPAGVVVEIYGKTTAQMKTTSTFTDAGWDFVNIWNISSEINDGYPYLIEKTLPGTYLSGEWENLNEYRCSGTIRQRRQRRTACSDYQYQWVDFDCYGELNICYDDEPNAKCCGESTACNSTSIGKRECKTEGSKEFRTCGNYDLSDACAEWSDYESCGTGKICVLGECIEECVPFTCDGLEVIARRDVCGWQSDGCGKDIYCGECIRTINLCSDYTTPEACNGFDPLVAVYDVESARGVGFCGSTISGGTGEICTNECKCQWGRGECMAVAYSTCSGGACIYSTVEKIDECNTTGYMIYNREASWSGEGGMPTDCTSDLLKLKCYSELNFFTVENFILTLIAVFFIYLILIKKGCFKKTGNEHKP